MDISQQRQLIDRAKAFFKEEIVSSHLNKACKSASKLSSYNVNPFLVKYLANFLKGDDSPRSIAEALVLPRILGSSINTSFGMKAQKLISEVFDGFGSTTSGIDIEFFDEVDQRRKYCQLKSGPNTINFDDVKTIINHFQSIKNLARTNNLQIGLNDLVVGVLYGEKNELSTHYQKIDKQFPVIVGKDFWHRITGNPRFYYDLIDAFGEIALEVDGRGVLEETIAGLETEIQNKF